MKIPEILKETEKFSLQTSLEDFKNSLLNNVKTLIYTYYNLDPTWHQNKDSQRVLLLEPSLFEKHPVTRRVLDFALELSKNIPDLKIYVGEFSTLNEIISTENIYYKEHPTNSHFEGTKEKRSSLSNLEGVFASFFNYCKKIKNDLQQEFEMR